MSVLLSPGFWTGAVALASGVLQASGHAPAAAIITDPHVADAANTLFTGIMGLIAGFSHAPGHKG